MSTDDESAARMPLCPSAQPDMAGAVVFGVARGTVETPRIAYLTESLPITPALLALADPVAPTEIFRFAAPCAGRSCRHFDGASCGLVTKLVQLVPPVVEGVPPCTLRPSCRWWQQEGKSACLRCPQIVTVTLDPSEPLRYAAPGSSHSIRDKRAVSRESTSLALSVQRLPEGSGPS
jgi:hypothetical protein